MLHLKGKTQEARASHDAMSGQKVVPYLKKHRVIHGR
jgi:hypothetical protein